MPTSKPKQSLRKTSASLYLITFILTLITTSTTGVTYTRTFQHPTDTFPIVASALATTYTLALTLLTFLSIRQTPALHLTSTLLSTSFLALNIAIAYLHSSSATLPCTAGSTSTWYNPYVTYCQLRQTTFWTAVLAGLGFAVLAILAVMMYRRAKRSVSSVSKGGEADATSVAPPSYQEKDGDVEGEGDWEQRVRAAV